MPKMMHASLIWSEYLYLEAENGRMSLSLRLQQVLMSSPLTAKQLIENAIESGVVDLETLDLPPFLSLDGLPPASSSTAVAASEQIDICPSSATDTISGANSTPNQAATAPPFQLPMARESSSLFLANPPEPP